MSKLGEVILRGTTVAKPAASIEGRLYYDTDLEQWERDTGASWEVCEPAAGGGDAGDITYTPNTLTDWDSDADPGDVDAALDQLAERVDDLEGVAAHDAVTLGADAGAILGLTGQQIDLDTQDANTILAGPTTGAAADPDFRALVVADLPSDAALWSIIQALHAANEVKNFPANVGIDVDLDAANQWWDKEGTPSAAVFMTDVAGEAGITETYEWALETTADASGEGFSQTFTYADEPRVKSGRVISAMAAIWVGTNGRTVTMTLANSDSGTTTGTATAQAWTIVKCENHTCSGTSVKLSFTVDGADTFYVVPLGMNIGTKAIALPPRGQVRVDKVGNPTIVKDLAGIGDENAWTDVDCTASTSNNCVRVCLFAGLYETTDAFQLDVRRNGDTGTGMIVGYVSAADQICYNAFDFVVDDGQIFEYKLDRTAGAGTLAAGSLTLFAFWEWA